MGSLYMQAVLTLLACASFVSALYSSADDVIELTPANFERTVLQGDEVWVVEFFAPWCGHCRSLTPEYIKAAKALKGVVKLGAVNADEHGALGSQYGVRGFPTLKIFSGASAADKRKPNDYQGARSAKGIVDAALNAASAAVRARLGDKSSDSGGDRSSSSSGSGGQDVVQLTDANFDATVLNSDDVWLVEFYAPWCGHCKSLEPHWAEAATKLKGKVKLGALDATEHTIKAGQYNIKGFPTIKFFEPGSASASDASEYDGGRTANDIVAWAENKALANLPAPDIVQLTSNAVLNEACGKHSLCVLAFVPHILDCQRQCRQAHLDTLQRLGERYKQKQWGWLWSQGGQQADVEGAVDIGGFGYPALVVVNSKKGFYATLRGAFSHDGINDFLRDLSYGRGSTSTIRGASLPSAVDVQPWDGQDAQPPAEEDIDLSDVELDDLPTQKREEL